MSEDKASPGKVGDSKKDRAPCAYFEFSVRIFLGSKYALSPDLVKSEVIPFIQKHEPLVELKHIQRGEWKLFAPYRGAGLIANILRLQFGFEVKDVGSIVR